MYCASALIGIQGDLSYDYRNSVDSYPQWQAWFREHQPPSWAGVSMILRSSPAGAEAFVQDLPRAEIHLLNAGHFALDESTDAMAELIIQFVDKDPG